MYNAFEKMTVLRDLWGFKQGDLQEYIAPNATQPNGIRRQLEFNQLSQEKSDRLVRGLTSIECRVGPPNLDSERLSQIFQNGSDFEFFSYLAELSEDAKGDQRVAFAGGASHERARPQYDDSFIEREILGLTDGRLKAYGELAFPYLLGTRGQAETGGGSIRCSFLYRLGIVPMEGMTTTGTDCDLKYRGSDPVYVIRRVPGKFEYQAEAPHRMSYYERYREQLEGEVTTTLYEAQGYVYAQERFLTVFSRDFVESADATPSLMQLNWARFRDKQNLRYAEDRDLIPGVLAGASDVPEDHPVPTAYRTLVRLLPPQVQWEDIKDKSRTLRFTNIELASDEKTVVFDGMDRLGKEDDDPADLGRDWSFYFDRLNVIRNPIDLLMCQRSQYIPTKTAEAAE